MEFRRFAADLAREAGGVLRHYSRRDKQVEFKGRANLVTVADKEAEELIIRSIRHRFPDHGILAEESGALSGPETSPWRWVIDPLDGTTNFAHQFPFYCVSIGLEHSGAIQAAAVYDPVRDELFSAARGEGATLNDDLLTVSGVPELHLGLLLTGFPYGFRDKADFAIGLFRAFMMSSQAIRRGGSAALDLCYLAAGRCDGFWELDLNPWDTAAGRLIVEEAGGRVTSFRGAPFSIDMKEIVASNGHIHESMLRVLESVNRGQYSGGVPPVR